MTPVVEVAGGMSALYNLNVKSEVVLVESHVGVEPAV